MSESAQSPLARTTRQGVHVLRRLRFVSRARAAFGFGVAAAVSLSGCSSLVTDNDAAVGADELPVSPDRTEYQDGWRWESSLGIELAVPNDWKVNDTDCNQT